MKTGYFSPIDYSVLLNRYDAMFPDITENDKKVTKCQFFPFYSEISDE